MKTTKLLPLMLILLFSISVFGQIIPDDKGEQPYIEVKGTAEKEIIPDEIFIAITIRERHEGKEKISIEKQESDLKQALMNIGIPLGNLQLAGANANYTQVRRSRKDVIAETKYMLKVWDAATVGKAFEVLDELKIQDANIARVSHSKVEEYRKEVKIMAIRIAKEKADYLLGAIGEQTGKPLVIYEVDYYPMGYNQYSNVAYPEIEEPMLFYDMPTSDDAIQFQNIILKASIYVKFGIE